MFKKLLCALALISVLCAPAHSGPTKNTDTTTYLPSGAPFVSTDCLPVPRGSSNVKICGSDIAAFVTAGGGGLSATLSSGHIFVGNVSNIAVDKALSGDCAITSAGAITCTKTGAVSFAASATTDTTNAANISSGTLPAARLPAFTGDITTSAGSSATTLATVNANVGSFGSTTAIPQIVIDAKGRITSASNQNPIAAPFASITGTGTGFLTAGAIAINSAGGFVTQPVANASLANSSVTIAGHSVSLGGTQALACADLSDSGAACSSSATVTVNSTSCTLGGSCTISTAPSGSAGGDLTGTYPNPTIGANKVVLADLATQAANTVLGNYTSLSAVPTAQVIGSCSTSGSAIIYTTGTGWGCNTAIAASTATTATSATSATTAATLATPRAIYGNNFDGSAALSQIIASTYGGTGNGFAKISGPTTAEKTFTLPDASTTILTTNAAVTVAQGGTGLGTLTAHNVITGNGTSTPNFVAPGASGNVLVSDGTDWTSSTVSGAGGISAVAMQVFTASGTYTPTSGMVYAIIECQGGGGGGGGATASAGAQNGGGGGGAGGWSRVRVTAAQIGASKTVTIGAAGTGSTATGGNGGDTSVGTLCVGKGGTGGGGGSGSLITSAGAGGAGGVAGTGDVTLIGAVGEDGFAATIITVCPVQGGSGGPSPYGGRGTTVADCANGPQTGGAAKANTGSGGAGAEAFNNGTAGTGGAGGKGLVIITDFK